MGKKLLAPTCLLSLLLVVSACTEKKMEPPKIKPKPAPTFILKNMKGKNVSLSDFAGKPVIINFWATWCVPCRAELPEIDRFHRAKMDEGLITLMINIKESENVVRDFLEKNGYAFETLLDSSGGISEKFQVFGLPTTYFVDGNGVIQFSHMGQVTKGILYSGFDMIKNAKK